jgi:hypothetical protein
MVTRAALSPRNTGGRAVIWSALVQNMPSQGLKFAPTPPGDESYPNSLYRSLVTEEYRLRATGAR